MDSSDGHGSGTLSAFITGALVGAGVALLFAPQPGSKLRGLLRDYAVRVNNEVDEAIDRGSDVWNRGMEHGQEFVERGKESLRETARQTNGLVEAGRTAVNDTKDKSGSHER